MAEKKIIFGRVWRVPELRYTTNQRPVCYFSIAETGAGKDKPFWHNVVVWGKQAEHASVFLKKGDQVFVRGQSREWEFKSTGGETKKRLELHADDLGFLTF